MTFLFFSPSQTAGSVLVFTPVTLRKLKGVVIQMKPKATSHEQLLFLYEMHNVG